MLSSNTENYKIEEMEFKDIYQIWRHKLWSNRDSEIEDRSAMIFNSSEYSIINLILPVWFFGVVIGDQVIGVNSCHQCHDASFRSRGLWVNEHYRKRGIGTALLKHAIEIAKNNNSYMIWSYPRISSLSVYLRAGYSLISDECSNEITNSNLFCRKTLI